MRYKVHHIWQSHLLNSKSMRPRRETVWGTVQYPKTCGTGGTRVSDICSNAPISRDNGPSSLKVYYSWPWTLRNHWLMCFTSHLTQLLSTSWLIEAKAFVNRTLWEPPGSQSLTPSFSWVTGVCPNCLVSHPFLALSGKHVRSSCLWVWRYVLPVILLSVTWMLDRF